MAGDFEDWPSIQFVRRCLRAAEISDDFPALKQEPFFGSASFVDVEPSPEDGKRL
jgi:hypothetical protein